MSDGLALQVVGASDTNGPDFWAYCNKYLLGAIVGEIHASPADGVAKFGQLGPILPQTGPVLVQM